MTWVLLRTVPFIGIYGLDAVRDSMLVLYAGFSFIVIALLLDNERHLGTIVRYYRAFIGFYVPAMLVIYPIMFSQVQDYIPDVPGTNIPFVWVDPGQVAVHLTGAALFALVGYRKPTVIWTALLFVTLVMVSCASRAGLLAFAVPVTFAAIILGKTRQLAIVLVAGLAIFSAAYVVETSSIEYREPEGSVNRPVSARQLADNISSIFGGEGSTQTEGTKEWRLTWWTIIVDDTVFGPNFWTGRGFGLNLGDADGFRSGTEFLLNLPPLRNPHNVHMTMLARAGVPGLILWGTFLASWLGMVLTSMWTARRHGQTAWAGLFLFTGCYAMSYVINASFDVALEGPMQGIWFWCLIGFGMGSVMIYRFHGNSRPAVAGGTVRGYEH
jgi:hypothetical protein